MGKAFAKLTRAAIRKLPPGKTIIEHGITFQRLANGDGLYSVGVMVNGQRIHRSVGRESEGTTRTQAEEYIQSLRIRAKEDRLSLPSGRKTALGFRKAADLYIQKLRESGGKDIDMKEQRLRLHLKRFFVDKPLSQISSFDVERYKKARLGEPLLPRHNGKVGGGEGSSSMPKLSKVTTSGTVNRELAVLSHLVNKAIEWGWIDKKPFKLLRLQENNRRSNYLTLDQINALRRAAQNSSNNQIYAFVEIALHTAMRHREVLSIRREHINLETLTISIPRAKAGARIQPITPQLAGFLASHLNSLPSESAWLFPSQSAGIGRTPSIAGAFRQTVKDAGLDPTQITPHTLRHTAISHLVQEGVDLPTVMRISGHRTLVMVQRYAHQNGAHIQRAMEGLGKRYEESASKPDKNSVAA